MTWKEKEKKKQHKSVDKDLQTYAATRCKIIHNF